MTLEENGRLDGSPLLGSLHTALFCLKSLVPGRRASPPVAQRQGHVHQIHFGESAWSFPLVLGLATAGPWDVSFALLLLFLNLGGSGWSAREVSRTGPKPSKPDPIRSKPPSVSRHASGLLRDYHDRGASGTFSSVATLLGDVKRHHRPPQAVAACVVWPPKGGCLEGPLNHCILLSHNLLYKN